MNQRSNEVIIALTGASGSIYGLRLIQRLATSGIHMHVLLSDAALVVLKQECDLELPAARRQHAELLANHLAIPQERIECAELTDWFSPAASGSSGIRHMVVAPCSMGTLARIAGGMSDNLIERAADVVLKERRQLILVPRETPLSPIHLENMLKLSRMGATLIPAMPGFYHRPTTIDAMVDFVVDRIVDQLHIDNPGAQRWGA